MLKKQSLKEQKTCIVYARVSTNEQSCDSQLLLCRQTAKQYGWRILKTIEEKQSGQSLERAGLQSVLEYAKNFNCSIILTKDSSRISRNQKHYLMIEEKLRKMNTQIFQVDFPTPIYDNNFDRKYSDDLLIAGSIPTFMSKLEINELVKKTRNGMRQRTLQGIFHHDVYGYKAQFINDLKGKMIIEHEAEVIRKCFELCIQGYGFTRIAKTLNSYGYSTRAGESFSSSNIREMLKNQIYFGKIEYKTIKEKPETWVFIEPDAIIYDPIITREIFDEAQDSIDSRRKIKSRVYSNTIFHKSGILKCGECGFSHTVIHKDGNYKTACNKNTLGKGCNRNPVKIATVKKRIYSKLKNIFSSKEKCHAITRKIIESDLAFEKKQNLYDFMQNSIDLVNYLDRPVYDDLVVTQMRETLQKTVESIHLKNSKKTDSRESVKIIFTTNIRAYDLFLEQIKQEAKESEVIAAEEL